MAVVASGLTIGVVVGTAYWTWPRGGTAGGAPSATVAAAAVPMADRTEATREAAPHAEADRTPSPAPPPVPVAQKEAPRSEKEPAARAAAPRQAPRRRLLSEEQQTLAALITQLSAEDKLKRAQAAADLAQYGAAAEAAIPGLLAMLGDGTLIAVRSVGWPTPSNSPLPTPHGCIGSLAAETLAAIGKPALPGLVAALESPNPIVLESAAWGLRIMKDGEALPALAAALERTRFQAALSGARTSILHALADLPHPDAVLVLLRDLTIKTDANRSEVIQLVGWRKDRRATETLCRIATSGQKGERRAAFDALAEIKDPDAVPLLRSICRTSNQWPDRKDALHALSKTIGSAALEEQIALLRAPDKYVREVAANAIRETADASTLPTLIGMLRDPNPETRRAVVEALARIADSRSTEALVRATRDADLEVRRLATAGLGHRQGKAVEEALIALLQSESDTKLQAKAISGLVNCKSQAAIQPLCRLILSNSDPQLRERALRGLGGYARWDKRVQATLAVVSQDKHPQVRKLAASLRKG